MNAFEERLRAAGWDDGLLHAEPGTLHDVTTEQMVALQDAIRLERLAEAGTSGVARGAYIAGVPGRDGISHIELVDGRNLLTGGGTWSLRRLAEKAVEDPGQVSALGCLDRLLSFGTPVRVGGPSPFGHGRTDLDADLYNERAGVFVRSRTTDEGHRVLDCHFDVTPEKAAQAFGSWRSERGGKRRDLERLSEQTVEDVFGRSFARIDLDDPADGELTHLLEANVSTPELGWDRWVDVPFALGRAVLEPERAGNLRALKEYAQAVGRAAADCPRGLLVGTKAEERIGRARQAVAGVLAAKEATDVLWGDIETISDSGGWLKEAVIVARAELVRGDSRLVDLDEPGARERLEALVGHECDLKLDEPLKRAIGSEAKARADELGDRMPTTRDEMSYWFRATSDRAYSMTSEEPEGPGWALVLGGCVNGWWSGYLTEEQQDTLLDQRWKNEAFLYLDNADVSSDLDQALDAWAAHAGDEEWLYKACSAAVDTADAMTYGTEFFEEDFEPGGSFYDDRGPALPEADQADGSDHQTQAVGSLEDMLAAESAFSEDADASDDTFDGMCR